MKVHIALALLAVAAACGGDPAPDGRTAGPGAEVQAAVAPRETWKPESIGGRAGDTIRAFLRRDPTLERFFRESRGFAVWPTVGKGGFILGGGGGKGYVFQDGELIGMSTLTFLSVGAIIGGQSFSELIFFRDDLALARFRSGELEFGAQVSAIAADRGVAQDANYEAGVAVFTLPKKGLMAEASVSGQQFSFVRR